MLEGGYPSVILGILSILGSSAMTSGDRGSFGTLLALTKPENNVSRDNDFLTIHRNVYKLINVT